MGSHGLAHDIAPTEEKELRRVYDTLTGYLPKSKLFAKLKPLEELVYRIQQHKSNPEGIPVYDPETRRRELSEEEIKALHEESVPKIEELSSKIADFDKDPNRKIRAPDLNECLRGLGYKASKKEVEDMIWEVDENLDGMVDWGEFKLMFSRNMNDHTGLEPFQLFNLVQFMMYDKDNSGNVTVDETMHMLYTRYGRDNLEHQMKTLFGEDLKTADGDGELSYSEFLGAMNVRPSADNKRSARKSPKHKK